MWLYQVAGLQWHYLPVFTVLSQSPNWKRSCRQPAQVVSALEVIASGILDQKKRSRAHQAVCKTSKPSNCPCLLAGLSTHRTCFSVHSHLNSYKLPISSCLKQCSPGKQPQMLRSQHVTPDYFQSLLKPCNAVAQGVGKNPMTIRRYGAGDNKLIQHSWKTACFLGPTTVFFPTFLGRLAYSLEHQHAICDS